MAFVAAATSVGAAVLGTGAAAGIGSTLVGGALIGAGVGGAYSAITGDGNILNSMLTGGLIGGGIGGLGAAMFPSAAGIGGASTAGGAAGLTPAAAAAAPSTAAVPTANVLTTTPAMQAAALDAAAVAEGATTAGMVPAANTGLAANTTLPASMKFTGPAAAETAVSKGLTGNQMLGYGLAGTAALSLLGGRKQGTMPTGSTSPSYIRPFTYSAEPTPATNVYPNPYVTTQYDVAGNPILDTRERTYFTPEYTELPAYQAAAGGLMSGGPVERMSSMDQKPGMYPMGLMNNPYYSQATQRPASMEVVKSDYDTGVNPITGLPPIRMAEGGFTPYQGYGSQQQSQRPLQSNPFRDFLFSGLMGSQQEDGGQQVGVIPGTFSSQGESNNEVHPVLRGMFEKVSAQPDYKFTKPELISGWQAMNPYVYDYNADKQTYAPGTPDPQQLSAFQKQVDDYIQQDRMNNMLKQVPFFSPATMIGTENAAGGGLMAIGGQAGGEYNLGSYSDGGRLLKGPGDGVSDDIPAVIGKKQPARLADGEFVIPARIVSELGNGSTDAGAKRLYAMMDRVQAKRQKSAKKGKFAINTRAEKELPA